VAAFVLATGLTLVGAACGTSTFPASSPASTRATGTPSGWVTHVYQHIAITVPASWTMANEPLCWPPAKVGLLVLGYHPGPAASCPADPSPGVPSVTVTPLSSPSSDAVAPPAVLQCPVIVVNGLKVHVGPCGSSDTGGSTWWAIPALNVQLVATNRGGSVPETGTTSVVGKVLYSVHRATPVDIATRGPLVTHITLAHASVRTGTPIQATVTFTNTTNQDILVDACAAAGWLDVGLAGNGVTFSPVHTALGCVPTVLLHPGTTSYPAVISTHYEQCYHPGIASQGPVACTSTGPSRLPAGAYRTVVIAAGLPDDTAPANRITVHLSH
jgi:hypothetical protein